MITSTKYRNQILIFGLIAISLNFKDDGSNHKEFSCPFSNGVLLKQNVDAQTNGKLIDPFKTTRIEGPKDEVLSASTGTIVNIFRNSGRIAIVIKSNNYTFTYASIDSALVSLSQKVITGQIIGISSNRSIDFIMARNSTIVSSPEKLLNCKCKYE